MKEAEYKDNEEVKKREKLFSSLAPKFAWLRDTKNLKLALWLTFSVLVATSFVGLLVFFESGSLWHALGACLVTVIAASLGILASQYKQVNKAINAFFTKYFLFCFWGLVTLAPVMFFLWLSQALVGKNLALQVFLLFLWGTLLGAALWLIFTSRNRERLFRWLEKVGMLAPFIYCFNIFFISVLFFVTVSYLFAGPGRLEFTNLAGETLSRNNLSVDELLGFFVWHFLDAIPFLKINDTLNWKVQLTYQSGFIGLIVLVFEIGVIIPIIAASTSYYKYWQSKRDRADKSGKAIGL